MHVPRTYPDLRSFFFILFLFLNLPFAAAFAETNDSVENGCFNLNGNTWPVVAGAELPSTNGIYFNARDELFVTSVVGRSITQLDPRNGCVINRLGPEQGIESPDDLIFDSAGNLYWTAFLTGEVLRLTPDGEKSTVAKLGRGVNAITLSADESKLYVSRIFLADDVWEIDLKGTNPPRLLAQNLGGFNGMDMGPDGRLYGPLWYHGQVASIDTATGTIEIVANDLATPAAVKFNHAGELFVVDQARGQVLRVDIENGELEWLADVGIGADNLAFNSQDLLYVTNIHDSGIRLVSGDSRTVNLRHKSRSDCPDKDTKKKGRCARHDPPTDKPRVSMITRPGLTTSAGIALHDMNGRTSLFVADIYSIQEYSPLSGHPRSIGHSIVGGVTELNTPFSVSSYGSSLLTTSWFANAVQIWDPGLHDVIDEYRDFAVPLNAIGFGDGVAVAELGSGCVMQQPADKSERQALACEFKVPVGLAQYNGKLFVSDWATGSVWQIANNHKAIDAPVLIASGLQQPEGMAVTEKGLLLVVETGADRLLEIDLSTGTTSILMDNLPLGNRATPGYPPTWVFNSIAVDDCGAVFFNVDGDRSVRRIADNTALLCEYMRQAEGSAY